MSTEPKKRGGDNGRRKPIVDEDGLKWCNCTRPNLTGHGGVGRGQAWCMKCREYWYH